MKNLKKEVNSLQARTPFQKTVKKALVSLMQEQTVPELGEPVEENLKTELVEFADFHGIEVPEPQNKDDYVKAIKDHFDL